MRAVGIREFKNGLSQHLRRVRSGETILITDRGEVVAEIGPPGKVKVDTSLPPGLVEMARKGLVRLGTGNDPSLYRPMTPVMTFDELMRLLDEERGER